MGEVTLIQMLDARERRAWEQQELLNRFGVPIVCFTMNIPGPVKNSASIRECFHYGCTRLEELLTGEKVLFRTSREEITGCEAIFCVDMDGVELKRICVSVEDATPLGRLFDMDVLVPGTGKLDRDLVGGGSRDCIVCGAPGRGCASRRVHSVAELQAAAGKLMKNHLAEAEAGAVGNLAAKALLDEVETTPKPGLVDLRNNGSHRDMDIGTFRRSAEALRPYFAEAFRVGQRTARETPEKTFALLRQAGLRAERDMYAATAGVNTHKGAIFSMGLLCGACGRIWNPEGDWQEAELFRTVSEMTLREMEKDFCCPAEKTAGMEQYLRSGIRGARGEAALGLPSVEKVGLPIYRELYDRLSDRGMAGAVTLLHLIVKVEDTNLHHRGGAEKAAEAVKRAEELLSSSVTAEAIRELDDWFIKENLSPGGCADLLAAVYFVSDLIERRNAFHDET